MVSSRGFTFLDGDGKSREVYRYVEANPLDADELQWARDMIAALGG